MTDEDCRAPRRYVAEFKDAHPDATVGELLAVHEAAHGEVRRWYRGEWLVDGKLEYGWKIELGCGRHTFVLADGLTSSSPAWADGLPV
jgi:hypothetical protein